jgi:predicted phage terminase large subunit-like protein
MGYEPARHHVAMLEAIRRVFEGETDVLLIDAPPGSAKSTYVTLLGSAYILARDPKARLILGTNSERLSEHWGRQLRNHIDSAKWRGLAAYGGAVGDLVLDVAQDNRAAARFALEAGGSFMGVGWGANLLGHRCDFLLLDDLVESFEVAFSEGQLAKLATWVRTDALTRLDGRIRVISVMQRMSHNDPHGIMSRQFTEVPGLKVEHLTLRMIAEGDDPLGRAPGEPLWPEHYTPQAIELARRDAVSWQTRFQQRPVLSTGEWCRREWIVHDNERPGDVRVYLTSDFATGAIRGDYTVHAVVGVRKDAEGRRHFHVLHVYRERVDVLTGLNAAFTLARQWGARTWTVDDDLFIKSLKGFIAEKLRGSDWWVDVRPIPMQGKDKETRAAALRALLADHRVHLPAPGAEPWVSPLVDELLLFPLGGDAPGVDDQIDALGVLARDLGRTSGVSPDVPNLVTYTLPSGEELHMKPLKEPVVHKGTVYLPLEELWDTAPPATKTRID